jgi:hypothetical protein
MAVSDGLLGYDYQVDVSVWLLLDLVLARRVADEVLVEPEHSLEDLQVAVDPDQAEGRAGLRLGPCIWQIQVKHRGSHWSPAPFADLLFGDVQGPAARKRKFQRENNKPVSDRPKLDPQRRPPPIELLLDPDHRYLLVTSAQASALEPHLVTQPGIEPGARELEERLAEVLDEEQRVDCYTDLTAQELASRIAVLDQVTLEVLHARIDKLLRDAAHVPMEYRVAARRALEAEVWGRMRGERTDPITRGRMEQVVREHGGHLARDRRLAEFIEPVGFDSFRERLQRQHAVLLLGAPGVGKTTCALALCDELRMAAEPFRVVEIAAAEQLHVLREPTNGPTVFLLHDPWGRFTDDDSYLDAYELLEELRRVSPERRLVITSPLVVYRQAVNERDDLRLQHLVVRLRPRAYDEPRRLQMLQRMTSGQPEIARTWLDQEGARLAARLRLPLELHVAATTLRSTWSEDPQAWPSPWVLIHDSRHEAITDRLVKELTDRSTYASVEAFLLVALLRQEGVLHEIRVRKLQRLQPDRIRPHNLLQWLRNRGSLREQGGGWRMHPLEVQALEQVAFRSPPAATQPDEYVPDLITQLMQKEQEALAYAIWVASSGDDEELKPPDRERLLQLLRRECGTASSAEAVRAAVRLLAERGDRNQPVEMLLEALQLESAKPRRGYRWDRPAPAWMPPSMWSEEDYARVSSSDLARQAVTAYFRYVFGDHPATELDYALILPFLKRLDWDLAPAFRDALPRVLEPWCEGVEVIVRGAVSDESPPWDELIQRVLTAYQEAEESWAANESAENDSGSEAWIEHVIDAAVDLRHAMQKALRYLVTERRLREGWGFLQGRSERFLLQAWAGSFQSEVGDLDERNALVAACLPEAPTELWEALVDSPDTGLAPSLLTRLEGAHGADLTGLLSALGAALEQDEFVQALDRLIPSMPLPRQVELLEAARKAGWVERPEYPYKLASTLTPMIPVAAALETLLRGRSLLTVEQVQQLRQLASEAVPSLAARALRRLALAGQPIEPSPLFLEEPAQEARALVVEALALDPAGNRSLLRRFLVDPSWEIRAKVVETLVGSPSAEDQPAVLPLLETEVSKHVRWWLTRIVSHHRWSEAIPWLIECLRDRVDWDPVTVGAPGEPDFRVAFAAAQALCCFEELPAESVVALTAFLADGATASPDPALHDIVLRILVEHAPREASGAARQLIERPWALPMEPESGSRTPIVGIAQDALEMLASQSERG